MLGKKLAIIIGIDRYDDTSFKALPYAREDAEAVHKILTDPDIGDFSREDSVLIVPKDNTVITKAEVEQKIEEIFLKADKTDTVLIYFAGHGKLDKKLKLRLAAQDTSVERLVSTSISMETVSEIIANSACRRAVFIIDSCYSGAAGLSARSPMEIESSLAQNVETGVVVLASCQAFQEALEKDDIKKGIFTDLFIKGLKDEEIDSDEDGNISLEEIWDYLETNVKTETKGRQVPARIGQIEGPVYIAKSGRFLRDRREKIEKYMLIAEERLSEDIKDKAFDAYRNVLKLEPKNSQALKGMTSLIEDMKDRLSEYQLSLEEEKIEANTYDEAHKVLSRTYLSLTAVQQECVRLILSLLINQNLETFEKEWKMLKRREQPLEQQQQDKLKREEEERKSRGAEQNRESGRNKAPVSQYSATARVEQKPSANLPSSSMEPSRAAKPAQIFVSYAHEDGRKFVDQLMTMLAPVMKKNMINWWDDSKIPKGDEWLPEIRKRLDEADIGLLFVSKEFLNSDFITKEEMPSLIEATKRRGVRFLWILVGQCLWREVPAIEARQALYAETPLNRLSDDKLEDALITIAEDIKKAAEDVLKSRARNVLNGGKEVMP